MEGNGSVGMDVVEICDGAELVTDDRKMSLRMILCCQAEHTCSYAV